MATLTGQRANFTWALNKFNASDELETKEKFARIMAKCIVTAGTLGCAPELVIQNRSYPAEMVAKYISDAHLEDVEEKPEALAIAELQSAVDCSQVRKLGNGNTVVYAYGYRCAPDRLKIGMTTGDTVQRIAEQIWTSTPDKPVLYLEIRTDKANVLERAIQAVLCARGLKAEGGGTEWFRTNVDDVIEVANFILETSSAAAGK